MSGEDSFRHRRGNRPPGAAPSAAPTLRSRAATNQYISKIDGTAAAGPGNVAAGSVVDYAVSVAGTDHVRKVSVNTTADKYKLYDTVEIPHLVLSMDPHEENDDYKVKTRVGEICPKWRPAVIVAIYEQRMTVLPIYTCKEKGVSRKPEHYRTTAMSVARSSMLRGSSAQSLTDEVLIIGDGWIGKPGQHINLNEPVSINYTWPIVKKSRLNKESAVILYKRFRTAHHMGTAEPYNEHVEYFQRKVLEDKAATRAQQPRLAPQVDADGFTIKSYDTRKGKMQAR